MSSSSKRADNVSDIVYVTMSTPKYQLNDILDAPTFIQFGQAPGPRFELELSRGLEARVSTLLIGGENNGLSFGQSLLRMAFPHLHIVMGYFHKPGAGGLSPPAGGLTQNNQNKPNF